jgi:hypothetical protein
MPFEARLSLFWLAVYAGLWYLRKRPTSFATRIAFSWHGPYPQLVQLLLAASVLAIAAWLVPSIRESETLLLVASFALSIGCGMALLGALLAWATSLKARALGPDPEFQAEAPRIGS